MKVSKAPPSRLRRALAQVEHVAESPLARGLLAAGALAVAGVVLVKELSKGELPAIVSAFGHTAPSAVAWSVLFTVISFACLTIQEWATLRYIGRPIRLGRMLAPSFESNAISSCVGVGLASGTALRLRLYPKGSLSARRTATLVLIFSAATMISALVTGGLALLAARVTLAGALGGGWMRMLIAVVLLFPAALWFIPLPQLRIRQRLLPASVRAGALAAGIGDWIFSCAALFVLTGQAPMVFPLFLAVFLLGSILGALVGLPGGVGVLDATVLALAPHVLLPHETAAALLLYRAIYFLGPLALALALLAARQGARLVRRRLGGGAEVEDQKPGA